jgi:hypothetical protein
MIKRILFSVLFLSLLSGCASIPGMNQFPALQNAKMYSKCSPVYETHVPGVVAQTAVLMDALKKNPSMADKVLPVTGTMDMIGKNAAQIGTGVAATVTAINGDISVASVVASAVMAGTKALMDGRSEDKTQSRVSVCMPDDADLVVFKNKDAEIAVVKHANAEITAAISAYRKTKKDDKPVVTLPQKKDVATLLQEELVTP